MGFHIYVRGRASKGVGVEVWGLVFETARQFRVSSLVLRT